MGLTRAIFYILTVSIFVSGVRITKLYVPRGASHEAPLDCRYDLESDQLYDVKWYKDGLQFLRCLPSGEIHEFDVEGVQVRHSNYALVGSCPLTLLMLSKKSAGEYKCEVSTEAPTFKTAVAASNLRIIEYSRRIQNDTKDIKTSTKVSEQVSENEISSSSANAWSNFCTCVLSLCVAVLINKCVIY